MVGELKVGPKSRTGLIVALGVLVGLGFIALPQILTGAFYSATPTGNSTDTTSGANSWNPSTSGSSVTSMSSRNETATPQNPSETSAAIGNLSGLAAFMIAPALAISLFTSIIASRRVRRIQGDSLRESSEDAETSQDPS